MKIQTAFENVKNVAKADSEDNTLSPEVRQYAKSIFMTMQAQQALIEYQEAEEVEKLMEVFEK